MNIESLKQSLPLVNHWIDSYIEKNKEDRTKVADAGFNRLNACFSPSTLNDAFYSVVERIETPPLSQLGLGELEVFESGEYGGITYKDTYFVTKREKNIESLHFHEMVHVIQWDELGAENFLILYAIGLIQFGYRDSPLEQIAYALQEQFECGKITSNCEQEIRNHSRTLKAQLG